MKRPTQPDVTLRGRKHRPPAARTRPHPPPPGARTVGLTAEGKARRRESPADTPNPAPGPDARPRPPRRRYLRPRRWPGLCGRRARSGRVLHKDRQPQTHSGRTEREGEEGGRDGGMRRLFCWCPRPRALPRGERVWGRGQHGGYIKKKLQKKRKTEKKRNRRSELERRREGGETKNREEHHCETVPRWEERAGEGLRQGAPRLSPAPRTSSRPPQATKDQHEPREATQRLLGHPAHPGTRAAAAEPSHAGHAQTEALG